MVYHVLNRGVRRLGIFDKAGDYAAFEKVLTETHGRFRCRVLSYCLMPNHWHLMLWPRTDGELSEFMRILTVTHTQRWHAHRDTAGTGPLYQGRFKSFPVQSDEHFLTIARYVERNPVRANLVDRAEDWKWSSLWRRRNGNAEQRAILSSWPVDGPRNWLQRVNQAETDAELESVRGCVGRGRPFGSTRWQILTANRLGLGASLRPLGRPKKPVT
ncbi:MAG TPA: hypothetical protein ENH84_07495 [Phycisphaerae bacterium]|nr:hypothetical protein [Phycisphaerae bacterium]